LIISEMQSKLAIWSSEDTERKFDRQTVDEVCAETDS
jgi:hypothetical protein